MTETVKDSIDDVDHEEIEPSTEALEDIEQDESEEQHHKQPPQPQPLPTDLTNDEAVLINIIRRVAREAHDLTESIRKADEKYSVIIHQGLVQEAKKDLKSGFDKLLASMVNSKAF